MRLDAYLAERDSDGPSGANLEYDRVFTDLMIAAQPGEEKQAGTEIIAAAEPNYREVTEKALAVLEQSHDLRAAVVLALAQLRLNGIEGFAVPVGYIRGLLETWWDTCHPQLDPDDDNDPTMRITVVLGLADGETILRGLRLAPLAQSHTLGRLTLRDIAVSEGEMAKPADMAVVPEAAAIAAAFKDTPADVLKARLEAARSALADTLAINRVFDERTPGEGPTLDPLIKTLKKMVGRLADAVGEPEEPAAEAQVSADGAPVAAGAPAAARQAPGTIASSADVEAALDRIIEYYARYEPSSPLPILLNRARRLVGADFMTILRDMAPNGIDNVRVVGGLEGD